MMSSARETTSLPSSEDSRLARASAQELSALLTELPEADSVHRFLPGKTSYNKLKIAVIRKGTKFYRVSDGIFFSITDRSSFRSPQEVSLLFDVLSGLLRPGDDEACAAQG
jgi:hypothetical protein